MNRQYKAAFLTFLFIGAMLPTAHAGFFGDVFGSNPITNFVDGAVSAVTNALLGIGRAVADAYDNLRNSNRVTPIWQDPNYINAARSPSGDNAGSEGKARNNTCIGNCTGINSQQYDQEDEPTNTYVSEQKISTKKIPSTRVLKDDFSEITISSLSLVSTAADGKFYSGTYWGVSTNLTNQGNADGTTDFRFYLDCQTNDNLGVKNSETVRLKELDWIKYQSAEGVGIPAGYEAPVTTTFWVDRELLQHGGDCTFTAEIKDNVQYERETQEVITIIDQILTVFGFIRTEEREEKGAIEIEKGVKTGSYTGGSDVALTKSIDFEVQPRTPELEGRLNLGVLGGFQ